MLKFYINNKFTMQSQIEIYTDGGSRGNPGKAGIGVVIKKNEVSEKYYEFIGNNKTNNEAEYEALIFALEKVRKILGKKRAKEAVLKCYSDSELMVKQLNHEYKLKNDNIKNNFIEIWNLILDFSEVKFFHIPRGQNKEADALANKAMNEAD